jgi:tRNA A-37 threonylcarbamoyl transferase component Bud32
MVEAGTVLNGTYRVEKLLGRGGMGRVYEASHARLPRRFAVKVLNEDASSDKTAVARFRREAEICSGLGHPNIVEVFDFNETPDGQPYIVMELLEGEPLVSFIRRSAPLTLDQLLPICRPVAGALDAVHEKGIVHRDLKPQNIFLSRRGKSATPKVLDFGISKIAGSVDLNTRSLTTMGTPAYMSPEQAQGKSNTVDGRADQFALAAIVYEMLAARHAFWAHGDDVYGILFRIVNEEPQEIAALPAGVMEVLWRALAKTAAERYPTTTQFIDELAAAGRGETVHGRAAKGTFVGGAIAEPAPSIDALGPTKTAASNAGEIAPRPTTPRRSWRTLVAAGSVATVVGVGALWSRFLKTVPTSPPPEPPLVLASPAPQPMQSTLQLRLTPADARATLDGQIVVGDQRLPRSGEVHKLHVEAEGYLPFDQELVADVDKEVVIELLRRPPPPRSRKRSDKSGGFTIEDPYKK